MYGMSDDLIEVSEELFQLRLQLTNKAIAWYKLAADDPLFSLMGQAADELIEILELKESSR